MQVIDTIATAYEGHPATELAVKKLSWPDFYMKNLSVIGMGYHTDEKVEKCYTTGDRAKV